MSDPTSDPTGAVGGGPVTTAAQLVRLRAEDDSTGLLFEGRYWTWREVVAEAELRAELLLSLRGGRPLPRRASCWRTPPSTCSCWPGRPWPGR